MTATAHAQPSSDQADLLFHQGKDLMAAGKVGEACAAFDDSQKLDPTTATLLNQANCRERNGQLATARSLFLEAARQTGSATDKASRQMHATAADRAVRLEPRLSTLRIIVPAASLVDGLEVLRDGEIVGPASWNEALPIDGGTYRISARAPGRTAWSSPVVVAAERDPRIIEVPELRAVTTDAVPPGSSVGSPDAQHRGAEATRWTAKRKLAAGVAAGGVVALGAGSVLGVLGRRKQSDAHAVCPDPQLACDGADRANELSRSAHNLAIGANVAFGVAAGAATAAVILWVAGAPEPHRSVAVVPVVSPGQFVVAASRSW
jgi:hypothetical protein